MKCYKPALFFILAMLLSLLSFSQSNYERGFNLGYISGYCFEAAGSCNVNVPKTKGSFGTYRAGYSTGFEKGLKARTDKKEKAYLKDYYDISNELRNTMHTVGRETIFTRSFEKVSHLYLIGDYERCIYLCEQLSNQIANDYRSMMFTGLSLLELEDFKQGRKLLKIAAKYAPENTKKIIDQTLNDVASGSYKANKLSTERAIGNTMIPAATKQAAPPPVKEDAGKVAKKEDIKAEPALVISGRQKYSAGDYAGAVAELTKAIEKQPSNEAYYFRALSKEQLSDVYGAANDFSYLASNAAADKSINYKDVLLRYTNILLTQKKYAQAIEQMDVLIKMNDSATLPQAYYNRGLAKINSSDKEKGCLDLSKAGELGYKEAYDAIKKLCN